VAAVRVSVEEQCVLCDVSNFFKHIILVKLNFKLSLKKQLSVQNYFIQHNISQPKGALIIKIRRK